MHFSFGFSLPSISMGSPQPFHTKPDTEGLYLFACGEVDGLTVSLPTLGAQSTPNKWDPLPSERAWVILRTFVGVHRSLGCLWYMTCGPSNPWEVRVVQRKHDTHLRVGNNLEVPFLIFTRIEGNGAHQWGWLTPPRVTWPYGLPYLAPICFLQRCNSNTSETLFLRQNMLMTWSFLFITRHVDDVLMV